MYIEFKLKGKVFDRHEAKRAAQELNLPYRKPYEWLSVGQAWKLLDCGYTDLLAVLLGEGKCDVWSGKVFVELYVVNIGDPLVWIDDQSLKSLRIHPDSVLEAVKTRQTKIVNKERALITKMIKEVRRR